MMQDRIKNTKSLWSVAANSDGSQIAEAAMIFPLLFMVLIGIFWLGRAFNIYSTITQAARAGARVAVAPACASCAGFTCGMTTGPYACDSTIVAAITNSLQASKLSPSAIQPTPPSPLPTFCTSVTPASCTVTSNVNICRGVNLNPAGATEECGILVTFGYGFNQNVYLPYAPGLQSSLRNLRIRTQVQMRAEQ